MFTFSGCGYNKLVEHQEAVNQAWSDMENLYQERIDKAGQTIESFGSTPGVNGNLIKALRIARDSAHYVSIITSPVDLGQEQVSQYEDAQVKLKTVLDSFFKIAPTVPALEVDPEQRSLKQDLKELDDKINAAMLLYNEKALAYNSSRQRAWKMVMVRVAGFRSKGYFQKLPAGK